MVKILRTDSKNKDFIDLIKDLDAFLKVTDREEHEFYNQYNRSELLDHVLIAYENDIPVGCAALKVLSDKKVEVKRMFTSKDLRSKGVGTKVLKALEDLAKELNYQVIILETGIRQIEAIEFYKKNLYKSIPNYGQYANAKNSLCFQKQINT